MNSSNLHNQSAGDLSVMLSSEKTSIPTRDGIMQIFKADSNKRNSVPATTWYYIYRVSPEKWKGRSQVLNYAQTAEAREQTESVSSAVGVLAVA